MTQTAPPKIIVDSRELNGGVVKALDRLNADYVIQTLNVGDYVVSDRCAFERKTTDDFLKSWLDEKKLFGQLSDLKNSYSLPILLIEGDEMSLFTARRVDPKAVQGCLFAIARMGIPVLFTLNAAGTANALYWYASKEQDTTEKKHFSQHGKRTCRTDNEQLEYSLSSLPDMGIVTARNLLTHFKTLNAIACADAEHLQKVKLVGKQTAANIVEFFGREYKCE